jgi:hypothetical protein
MAFVLNMVGAYNPIKAVILVVTHIVIDYVKSHAKDKHKQETVYLYIDQFLHICINIAMYLI